MRFDTSETYPDDDAGTVRDVSQQNDPPPVPFGTRQKGGVTRRMLTGPVR